jgi:hypothetical protein
VRLTTVLHLVLVSRMNGAFDTKKYPHPVSIIYTSLPVPSLCSFGNTTRVLPAGSPTCRNPTCRQSNLQIVPHAGSHTYGQPHLKTVPPAGSSTYRQSHLQSSTLADSPTCRQYHLKTVPTCRQFHLQAFPHSGSLTCRKFHLQAA